MVTPHEAAVTARTDARAIFRQIEAGTLHFLEDADGRMLICRQSLWPSKVQS